MRKFSVKSDLPFGGKKGRIFIADNDKIYWEDDGSICPYNPIADGRFFIEILPDPEPKFPLNSFVILKKATLAKIVKTTKAKSNATIGKNVELAAFVPLKIIRFEERGSKAIVLYHNFEYSIMTSALNQYSTYWFINSRGIVCQAILGKDTIADEFRRVSLNRYVTASEATLQLVEKILNENFLTSLIKKNT